MNWLQKLIQSDSAIARWRQHRAAVTEAITGEGNRITATFMALQGKEQAAKTALAEDPTVKRAVEAIKATSGRMAQESVYDYYRSTAGAFTGERIDAKLDLDLLAAAVAEARREIKGRREEAIADAEKLTTENSLPAADLKKRVEDQFARRLAALDSADHVIGNTRRSTPAGKIVPYGATCAANYLDNALDN